MASSSTAASLPIEASLSGSLSADVEMRIDVDASSPGPSLLQPLYSDIGNNPEIEKNVKLLLVDRGYSLFDMPIMQLLSVLKSHSINTCDIRSADVAIHQALDHIVNGKCFLKSSSGSACSVIRRGIRDVRAMTVLTTETVLLEMDDFDRIRSVCYALGYTSNDLSKVTGLDNMKTLIELSRDNFSTCYDIPDILCNLENMSIGEKKVLCRIHSVDVTDLEGMTVKRWTEAVLSRLVMHFSMAECEIGDRCAKPGHLPKCKRASGSDALLKVSMLESFLSKGNKHRVKTLRLLLSALEIEYDTSDNARVMASRLKKYARSLRVAKEREIRTSRAMLSRVVERQRIHDEMDAHVEEIRRNWPMLTSENVKEMLLSNFQAATSSDALRTRVCAVCSERKYVSDFADHPIPVNDPNLHLDLLRCSYPIGVQDPFDDNDLLRGVMLDRAGFVSDPQEGGSLWTCRFCYRTLSNNIIPRCALANGMFVGEVPDCLKDLTVVEEAMIARRRAKCWIIHLNEGGGGVHRSVAGASHGATLPSTQRGMKGHIIVYPSAPQNIGSVLPPSMEETVTPMCVVFVGSCRPSEEWLRTKAKPLLVRREKVRTALIWLKNNNPLYADVIIDNELLDSLPDESVAPVEISVETATESSDAVGARHDNVADEPHTSNGNGESRFEKAVVADLDMTKLSSAEMCLAALKHLKSGGEFVQIPHGSQPCNEYEDFNLFPLLYPTLFPYGHGGFEHPDRRRPIGIKLHARHLFSLADNRFQEHYSFLFTVFNILQRRIVSQKARLKVKKSYFDEFANSLHNISEESIAGVAERYSKGDFSSTYSDQEKLVLRLMREVNLVSQPVPGSSSSKHVLRNQIRAMMTDLGLPSFYITINPADIYNPLVRFLAGEEIDVDNIGSDNRCDSWKQSILVARNPFVAGKFFHIYMQAFFKCLLGFDVKTMSCSNGLFGITKGYFGCVEAQGRGSLHCHLLVWLEGALDPQEIKDRIVEEGDQEFGHRLCRFIDDSISNGVPPEPPIMPGNEPHPCSVRGPWPPPVNCSAEQREEYNRLRQLDIHRLARSCQTHTHTHSCYKYWKGGDERKECRFNLDQSHHVERTTIDPVTGEMDYRIEDGMVNNFCVTILRAIRSNMDIKFIGSGASAKAILYYITDYITKSQLKAHVAYQILQAAVKKLENYTHDDDTFTVKAKRMLVRCANALISQQELSAPQVVSYLMGYGDHYTSHRFRNLFWKSFENHIIRLEKAAEPAFDSEDVNDENLAEEEDESENLVVVERQMDGSVTQKGSQLLDYTLRGDLFDEVCVYDFVANVDKVRIPKKKRKQRSDDEDEQSDEMGPVGDEDEDEDDAENEDESAVTSRPFAAHSENPRSSFYPSHPEVKTHMLRRRKEINRLVPVPIGPRIYRRDVPDIREEYCRLMLILFKPWRNLMQLKEEFSSWEEAFQSFNDAASPRVLKIMENMQRLHECRDSRDDDYANRRLRNRGSNSISEEFVASTVADGLTYDDVDDSLPEHEVQMEQVDDAMKSQSKRDANEERDAAAAVAAGLEAGLFKESTEEALCTSSADLLNDAQRILLLNSPEQIWRKDYRKRSQDAKKKLISDGNAEGSFDVPMESTTADIQLGRLDTNFAPLGRFPADETLSIASVPVDREPDEGLRLLESICSEFTLNSEQAAAFREIALHSLLPQTAEKEPIRMYLGGPGGTGKSRVLDALKAFFDRRQESRRLRVASYTGVAAANVAGVTLHSALQVSQLESASGVKSKAELDLIAMWKGVDYLFIDEISMVGCKMLRDVSHNLSIAKGTDESFGGISVVFAGDFCQLPPIKDTALYVPSSRSSGFASTSQTENGQKVVKGRSLWLQLTSAHILKQQMRQSGESNSAFRSLLTRLRLGKCNKDDVSLLKSRVLENLRQAEKSKLSSEWGTVPIITARNAAKDALNARAVQKFAKERGLPVHYYYARDSVNKEPITGLLKERLLDLHSGKTQQLGKLPLVIGMPVVLTHNYDVTGGVVNGAEGILKAVRYETDSEGRRYATSCVVSMPSSRSDPLSFLEDKEVVALPETTSCKLKNFYSKAEFRFSRSQLPIMPAFAYTDYKAQGRTMEKVIVDLQSCRNLQSVYVMLSRAKSLDGLLILRDFQSKQLCNPLSGDLRTELNRLDALALETVRTSRGPWTNPSITPHVSASTNGSSSLAPSSISSSTVVSTPLPSTTTARKRRRSYTPQPQPPTSRRRLTQPPPSQQ